MVYMWIIKFKKISRLLMIRIRSQNHQIKDLNRLRMIRMIKKNKES